MLLSKIDAYGKSGWLALGLLLFWAAWPLAALLLAFLYFSGRLHGWRDEFRMPGTWFNLGARPRPPRAWAWTAPRSGHSAFDDYRDQTLRSLEEDQQEFQAYLDRLRKARDKAEFDAFMAERRARTESTETRD